MRLLVSGRAWHAIACERARMAHRQEVQLVDHAILHEHRAVLVAMAATAGGGGCEESARAQQMQEHTLNAAGSRL